MSEQENSSDSDSEHTLSHLLFFFTSLLVLVLLLSKMLHRHPKLNKVLSEPGMTLIIGIVFSLIIRIFFWTEEMVKGIAQGEDEEFEDENDPAVALLLSFPNDLFFLGLLPPILFNSGYELQRELFFRHIKAIISFATVGTVVSGFSAGFVLIGIRDLGLFGQNFYPTSLELLTFGALIAATDTVSVLGVLKSKRVDPHLFNLVFGESALNDAVALILFKSLSKTLVEDMNNDLNLLNELKTFVLQFTYMAIGSPLLGFFFSFLTALLFMKADFRQQKNVELSLYILLMYIPYFLAENCHLSGIVSIFFTGMCSRRYLVPNVSAETARNAQSIFKVTAYLAETAIFLELGLSVFGHVNGGLQWRFTLSALLAALLGRAVSIYPISIIYNSTLKESVRSDFLYGADDDSSVGSHSSGGSWSSRSSGGSGRWRRGIRQRRQRRQTPERRKDRKIPPKFMHILWFAGLRGAVAYACAKNFPNEYGNTDEFVTTTMIIVLVTIIFMGGFTDHLLDSLEIRSNVDEKEYMKTWHRQRRLKGTFHQFENDYIYRIIVREQENSGESNAQLDKSDRQMMEFVNLQYGEPDPTIALNPDPVLSTPERKADSYPEVISTPERKARDFFSLGDVDADLDLNSMQPANNETNQAIATEYKKYVQDYLQNDSRIASTSKDEEEATNFVLMQDPKDEK